MGDFISLDDHLQGWSEGDPARATMATTLAILARLCRTISEIVAKGRLADPELQRAIDMGGEATNRSDGRRGELLMAELSAAPVAAVVSGAMKAPRPVKLGASLIVAIQPLCGSPHRDADCSLGTTFSILPSLPGPIGDETALFLRRGTEQLAAGYAIYGPQTALALTLGSGVDAFTLDRASGTFRRTMTGVRVRDSSHELAINAGNYRHWDRALRVWFDDSLSGTEGPRGQDCDIRWTGSIVAEAHRILMRGGIYVDPGDARRGYPIGLVCEANPVAMLMEQAGAAASTGYERILDRLPRTLDERVAVVFGSAAEVERVVRCHVDPYPMRETSPLFARRGLFRV